MCRHILREQECQNPIRGRQLYSRDVRWVTLRSPSRKIYETSVKIAGRLKKTKSLTPKNRSISLFIPFGDIGRDIGAYSASSILVHILYKTHDVLFSGLIMVSFGASFIQTTTTAMTLSPSQMGRSKAGPYPTWPALPLPLTVASAQEPKITSCIRSAPLLNRFITEPLVAAHGWFWHSNTVYFAYRYRQIVKGSISICTKSIQYYCVKIAQEPPIKF